MSDKTCANCWDQVIGGNDRHSVDAFQAVAVERGRALYPKDKTGYLILELDENTRSECATCLISEHRPAENRQYQVDLKKGERVARELPAGGYTVVVRAPGLEPHRRYIEVAAQQSVAVSALLEEPARNPATLEERLAKYGLKLGDIEGQELTVPEGTSMTLDDRGPLEKGNVRMLTVASVDDAKRILGNPDEFWPGEFPRYGKMVDAPTGLRPARDEMNMLLDTRFALREYVYGNSKSVARWKGELDSIIKANPIDFPLYPYLTVTVDRGAVLKIGAVGLFCHTLRVHHLGKIRVVGHGPTTIETAIYEQFWTVEQFLGVPLASFHR